MKMILGILLSNFTTAIFFLFLFLIEYSGGALYTLAAIMAIGYLGSIALIYNAIDNVGFTAYNDGYSDAKNESL